MVCLTSESGCGKRGKEEISGLVFFSVSRTNRSSFKNTHTHNGRYQRRPPVIWNKRDIHPPDNRRLGKLEILEAESRDPLFYLFIFFRASFLQRRPHYYAAPMLLVCIQLSIACSQWPSGGEFSFKGANTVLLLSGQGEETHNGLSKKKSAGTTSLADTQM